MKPELRYCFVCEKPLKTFVVSLGSNMSYRTSLRLSDEGHMLPFHNDWICHGCMERFFSRKIKIKAGRINVN